MASLTHVCMWSGNGWKRITAAEAARLHPGGTVSAHSGLFMCELCGQYVTLTDGDIRTRYFKHSAGEKIKDCPERTFGAGCSISYNPQNHDLPLRITNVSASSFEFELGLIRAPFDSLGSDFRIVIRPAGADLFFEFTKERLNRDGITYLPIGKKPFKKYSLSFLNGDEKLHNFWPAEIVGFDPEGTLFERDSGKKLAYDADVEIEKEYYLLKCGRIYGRYHSIQIREVTRKQAGPETWILYIVRASGLDEEAARFYLDFHCRLTDHPVSMQPVWPLFVEGDYLIRHNQNSMYVLVEGDAVAVNSFPAATVLKLENDASLPGVYKIFCSARQQLISAGRTQALQYTYFWKEPLSQEGSPPEISVTDLTGADVSSGEYNTLPEKKILRFRSEFDGTLILSMNGQITDRQELPADQDLELEVSYGLNIKFVVGLDTLREIDFRKRSAAASDEEADILQRITGVSGPAIPAPHALRNIMAGMQHYPLLCQWIRKCIKAGTINEQSYRRLQELYRSVRADR